MYKVGIFPGKFLPPHRGHINAIIQAATQVEKLYVVVSCNHDYMKMVCDEENIRYMPLIMRARWMAKELSGFDHIKVYTLDETDIPAYPEGTVPWSKKLKETIPEEFDVIFGGEPEYQHTYMQNFPGVDYVIYDTNRERYPVSATLVRQNPMKYWDYILGSARPHFAKRILITGTESSGKTTLTKYLAKIYHTSWSEEYGRYHSTYEFGGNENLFTKEDFNDIAQKQIEYDNHALRTANKLVFFDTDAVVTHYYRDMYLGEDHSQFEEVDVNKYDLIIMLGPEVKWVSDGFRFKSEQEERDRLYKRLYNMYLWYGFDDNKIIEIHSDDYHERLNTVMGKVENLLEGNEDGN